MAFIVNDVTVGAMAGLATVTLHETASGQNRVVHVIVPMAPSRQTPAMRKKQARSLAKAALQAAAAAL